MQSAPGAGALFPYHDPLSCLYRPFWLPYNDGCVVRESTSLFGSVTNV